MRLCVSIEKIPHCGSKIPYILRNSTGCDLAVIIRDPEWGDAKTLRYVPHKAGVTLFVAVKILGRIIYTVCLCQLDKNRIA